MSQIPEIIEKILRILTSPRTWYTKATESYPLITKAPEVAKLLLDFLLCRAISLTTPNHEEPLESSRKILSSRLTISLIRLQTARGFHRFCGATRRWQGWN